MIFSQTEYFYHSLRIIFQSKCHSQQSVKHMLKFAFGDLSISLEEII